MLALSCLVYVCLRSVALCTCACDLLPCVCMLALRCLVLGCLVNVCLRSVRHWVSRLTGALRARVSTGLRAMCVLHSSLVASPLSAQAAALHAMGSVCGLGCDLCGASLTPVCPLIEGICSVSFDVFVSSPYTFTHGVLHTTFTRQLSTHLQSHPLGVWDVF